MTAAAASSPAVQMRGISKRSGAVQANRAVDLTVPKGTTPRVTANIVYTGPLRAPLPKGAQVAGLEVRVEGQAPHYLPLVTARAVGRAGPIDRIVNGLLGLLE